ncbi:hypothetical protein M404DRAFT_994359 [Pisolithus tinctorius Marx 270]|uniref:Uncharacterized protein n=1 Tax=Pisolithus tinctorius Marx 270 TaxID=870435 RepID=A0A0C3JR17_PISTI|nr:hypothetical protein M404DRAFT_994359 [Pisolithus tinctorius Marx 270]
MGLALTWIGHTTHQVLILPSHLTCMRFRGGERNLTWTNPTHEVKVTDIGNDRAYSGQEEL